MGRMQSLTDEPFMDVARVYPATFQRSSVVFCEENPSILFFLFVDFLPIFSKACCNTFWYRSYEENYMTACNVRSKIVVLTQV